MLAKKNEVGGSFLCKLMIVYILFAVMAPFSTAGCSQRHMRIDARFERLDGLRENDKVFFDDKEVGSVEDIDPGEGSGFIVHMKIDKQLNNLPPRFECLDLADDPQRTGRKKIVIKPVDQGGMPLEDGILVKGGCGYGKWAGSLQKQIEDGMKVLSEMARRAADSLEHIANSEEYKRLQQDLKELADEIAKAGQLAHDKVVKEILPELEKRLEALKEKLKKYGEQKKIEKLEEQLEKIRKI